MKHASALCQRNFLKVPDAPSGDSLIPMSQVWNFAEHSYAKQKILMQEQ